MFSSFSNNLRKRLEDSLDAVEHLAAAQINPRTSIDQQTSSSKLSPRAPAEALNDTTKRQPARPGGRTMTLEDRLKAKFAVGEASGNSTAAPSVPSSPAVSVAPPLPEEKPKSPDPRSIPLPPSPQLLPAAEITSVPPLPQEPAESNSTQLPSSPPAKQSVEAALPSTPSNPVVSLDEPLVFTPSESKSAATESTPVAPDLRASPKLATPFLYVSDRRGSIDSGRGTPPLDRIEQMDVDELRKRLKVVEQRFSDVSRSFKRLQAEKVAADQVLKDLTPLESISETDSLRDHFRNLSLKAEISSDEIKRLNLQIQQHDGRIQDLRDTHKLESHSQSEQIETLRKRVTEAEALLTASSSTTSNIEAASSAKQKTIDQLTAELQTAKTQVRDEEEKRVKAIALLKTVRTKLVQAEKDKESVIKDKDDMRIERDAARGEAAALRTEVERLRAEKEREVATLRLQFDRELSSVKERLEKEAAARKAQFELDAITTKAAHTKELNSKANRIAQLEGIVKNLTQEKDSFFAQMQVRQAELESSQSHTETLQNQNNELQFQLREANDRIALLESEETPFGRIAPSPHLRSHNSGTSVNFPPSPSHEAPAELARLLSETESKYEGRLSDLRSKIQSLEKERNDSEEEWAKNLAERGKEIERLKRVMVEKETEFLRKAKAWEESETRIGSLERSLNELKVEREELRKEKEVLATELGVLHDAETTLKEDKLEAVNRVSAMERQLDELRSRESQLKSNVKTLREELRKVQSSAALLERQRNPGVGYWAANGSTSAPSSRIVGTPSSERGPILNGSAPPSPAPPAEVAPPGGRGSSSSGSSNPEEAVNLEYLRNVILQFLENEKMRPDLVRVMSIILRFTPQETRRLLAKVG
ncbi:hypothetical protein FRB90_004601 [Tulasnella sp. 427]|nr:hypothetical protein FRB90_004601 [Tulasnella sp. 427]